MYTVTSFGVRVYSPISFSKGDLDYKMNKHWGAGVILCDYMIFLPIFLSGEKQACLILFSVAQFGVPRLPINPEGEKRGS